MYIERFDNNGNVYLRLVESKRVKNADGKSVSKKVVIRSLGPYSKYDDGKPDYLERLRRSFSEGTPLIPELLPYVDKAPQQYQTVKFPVGDTSCFGTPKDFAACILDPVFSGLGLDSLFASIKHASGIEYDLQGIMRLLTYGRLLSPSSKIATMRQNNNFYTPLVKSSNDDNVYDALDVLFKNRQQVIRRMNTCITRGIGRKVSTVFYDVSNFFFEIEEPDEDVLSESGEVLEVGLRKMGVSKENRKQPIVQMGLFLDDNGIPISIEAFPGNTLDHLTLRTAMKRTIDTLEMDRFILVADRGMYSGTNMCHVLDTGNGYIVSKSLKKSTREDRAWVLDQTGYTELGTSFRYKSRVVTRTVTGVDGKKKQIEEKMVVYWSEAYYKRELHENQSFLDFIERLKANPHGFRITAAQTQSLRRFLKKEMLNSETGEVIDGSLLLAMIDDEKLREFNELMGYYQIVSSEIAMDDKEIIDKYHGLTRIEDQFREMKSTLETRPIYVRTPAHIQAHLLICFIALTMLRIIQYKTRKALPEDFDKDLDWSYGIPGARIISALNRWQVNQLPGEWFQLMNMDDPDLVTMLTAFGIKPTPKLYTRGDLRALKASVTPF